MLRSVRIRALSSLEPSRRGSAVVQTIAIAMSVNVMDSRANREVAIRSNEKEISHGRVLWQIHWNCFAMGPLASSIG